MFIMLKLGPWCSNFPVRNHNTSPAQPESMFKTRMPMSRFIAVTSWVIPYLFPTTIGSISYL